MSHIENEPYSTFSKRMTDWLLTVGGEVADLTLDLFNRGQDHLWLKRDWEDLLVRTELSLTDNSVALPSDFGRVVRVWHDSNSDGKPDFYYYARGRYDDGFYIADTFAKATGHSRTINFFRSPSHTPTLEYIKLLDHFVGSGTEYSYFPPLLLMRAAQKVHIEESEHLDGNAFNAIMNSYAEELSNYEASNQFRGRDMRAEILDDNGTRVDMEGYNLGGDMQRYNSGFPNDYHLGG